MRKVHKGLLVAGSGFITMILAAGGAWAQSATPSATSGDTGGKVTFVEGTTNDMRTVNPFKAIESPEYEVLNLNFDLLEYFNHNDLTAAPGIATGWTQSDDGLTWTFNLRDDVTWQDGEPLTAEDIAFTYNTTIDCDLGNSVDYMVPDFTKKVEATSPTELVWTTSKPTTAPIRPPWVYIVPQHIWGSASCEEINKAPFFEEGKPMIGSGPFQLIEWNKGEDWTMKANPDYWGGTPHIDEFKVVRYDNGEAMVNALKNGEIDFANITSVDLFNDLQSNGADYGISTHVGAADYFSQMSLNMCDSTNPDAAAYCKNNPGTGNPALRDPAVRQAIAWSIDKQTLVDNVQGGYGYVGTTIVPPFSQTFHYEPTGDEVIGFDIAHANQILDDAGYADTDGDGVRNDPKTGDNLDFRFILRSESEIGARLGDYISGWLKQIGISTKSEVVGDGKLVSAWLSNDYDLYIWGWGPDPDPDFILSTFTRGQCGGWSDTCYADPAYDKMYAEQQTALTTQDRQRIITEMQQKIYNDVPEIVLMYQQELEAYDSAHWQGLEDNISPQPEGTLWAQYTPYSALTLAPRGTTASPTSSSNSPTLLIVGILSAIIVVVGIVMIYRGKRNEEDLA